MLSKVVRSKTLEFYFGNIHIEVHAVRDYSVGIDRDKQSCPGSIDIQKRIGMTGVVGDDS